ncbi:MAG: hypothetical protein K2P81_00975 [Bacteriovoracaceae bacterium]|nr:hypothetical protein [Bacteriovoracaceae bacterium]
MDKKYKPYKLIKNRTWKSKLANRLKGKSDEICQDYLKGLIDSEYPIHVVESSKLNRPK